MASYGPVRIGIDGRVLSTRRSTPIRDHVNRRRAELNAERVAITPRELSSERNERILQLFEDRAVDRRRRRLDAFRVVLKYQADQRQTEAEAQVREIRRGVENLLELDGWSPEDIKTLLDSTPPRQYPVGDMYMVPVDDEPKLRDVYSWKIGRDGRYHLDLYPGQVQPLPDPDVPPLPDYTEITLNLSDVYGSWRPKTVAPDQSLGRFESTIPGGKKNLEA